MTEKEIENTEVEEEETVETQDKKEKLLSQAEVNKLLAKERRDAKAKLEAAQEEFNSGKSNYEATIEKYEALLKKGVEDQLKAVPAPVKALLEKLSLEEQMEWLANPDNLVVEKKKIPLTPEEEKGKEKGEQLISRYKYVNT